MSPSLPFAGDQTLVQTASDALVRSALAGGVLIAAVWLLCRLIPATPPRVRAALWWTACLKLVVGVAWVAPIGLPLLPAPETPALLSDGTVDGPRVVPTVSPHAVEPEQASEATVPPSPLGLPAGPFPWRPIALLLWLAGVATGLSLDLRGLRLLRRTLRSAEPLLEGPVAEQLSELSDRLGLKKRPRLLVTDDVATPQAVGLLSPAVVLPTATLDAPRAELAMVLAHELIHLRRRDLWLAWVPRLARRIFFFHPLALLAEREHALAREAACDAEVLDALGTAPRAYGRLLVRWGVAPRETGLAAAGAAPSVQLLKRRLQMLHRSSKTNRRSSPWWWLFAAAVAVALVPVTIVAQAPPAAPSAPAQPAAAAPSAPAAPPAPPTAATLPSAPTALAAAPALPSPPPLPAIDLAAAPELPAAPEPPAPGVAWSWSSDGEAFAFLSGDSSVWIDGSSIDSDKVRALRKNGEPLLWFRRDGAEYVVRDRELVEQAREILRPQMELGEQQAELGGRQGELGAQQGELGARQGELGSKQGALGAEQARLAAAQAELAGTDGREAELRERRDELERRMRELAARQRELAERQRELGAKQRALAEPQRELGERQRELGEKQRESVKRAKAKIERLVDQALASKKALRID